MELLVGILICFIIYIVYKKQTATDKKTYSKENLTEFQFEIIQTRPSGKPAKWYGFKEDITVNNINIKDGLIYVGEVLLDIDEYENDASLINPKLGILPAKSWEHGDLLGYWPRYSQIPEQCRGAYLNWLTTNRSEPEANIGYVFLFFYGLERRIFIDGQKYRLEDVERNHIIDEVKRLLTVYGNNRSFKGYANNFLATEWILYHRDKPPPSYIDFNDRYCLHAFQFLLAQYVAVGKPIPADIALQWLILHPDFSIKTPARRCPKEFLTLFCYKYREKFGDGLTIAPNKTRLILEYRAASPSLRMLKFENINLPNPFILTTPAKSIYDLIEECTNELEQYSRYLSRKSTNPLSVNALALLPNILISQISPLKQIQNKLTGISNGKIEFISINTIYEIFGETKPDKMSIKDTESLAIVLESLGFGIIPDSRFYNINFNENSKIIIFTGGHGQDFTPSREFHIIGTIIRLGSIVAQVGEGISSKEENTLQKIIRKNNQLSSIERVSLMIFLYWCLRTPQTTAGLQKKLEVANTYEKQAISSILISVALADGRIESEEIKQLEKLYTTLGLDKKLVSSDIHQLTTANEPVRVGFREKEINYQIPSAQIDETLHGSFSLNENLVKIREEETRQVKGILEEIFTEREDVPFYQAPPPTGVSKNTPLLLLDQNHQSLFNQLIVKENWNKNEVHDVCKKLGLMTDGAMETLNEWAFNLTNAPLLEDGEVIYVDINLAEEILNVQRT